MTAIVGDHLLDAALNILDTVSTHIYITFTQDPVNFTEATSTYACGNKSFGTGACFGAPAAKAGNGRKVTSAAITDGSVTATQTALGWAVTTTTGSKLDACGHLSSSQAVTSGNQFTLAAFDIGFPNQ